MKTLSTISDLGLFGAPPLFAEKLHVGCPNLGDRDHLFAALGGILDRRWLTNGGPVVEELENAVRDYLGAKHVIAACNGTLALVLAVRALGLTGEVILPSFTFVADAHVLQWHGIKPVFADINPRTHNIDPQAVADAITSETTGILGVHLWGRPCDVEALQAIARKNGLKLLLDASHAFGCTRQGRLVGRDGDCEVFSLHATKVFHAFEGGLLVTDNGDLARNARLMLNHGFEGSDRVVSLGLNAKMTEVCAAMGLTNLRSVDRFIEANRRNYRTYGGEFEAVPGVILARLFESERGNYHYVIAEIDEESFGLSRDALYAILHAENVIARRYFHPGIHRMEPYRTLDPDAGRRLPHTEALCRRTLAFPTGTQMTPETIAAIGNLVAFCHAQAREIRQRLGPPLS